jgi:hypothetical protein
MGWGSSVSIVTLLLLGQPRNLSIPNMGTGVHTPMVKRPECRADHSSPSVVGVRNERR